MKPENLELIKKSETPVELSKNLSIEWVETARHWSDLYEGRSGSALLITTIEEFELMAEAVKYHNIEGDFVELKKRDGAHHWEAGGWYNSLEDYQKIVLQHFGGDKYTWQDSSTELSFVMSEIIPNILSGDEIAEEKADAIIKNIEEAKEKEAGYYDFNGNLEISAQEINHPDFSGYRQDVYTYCFGFSFKFKNALNKNYFEDLENKD